MRTPYPIPAACGLYYFEVKIISKGRDGYMGIGLTAQNFKPNRLPGWDKQSYGYHGDDGNSFSSSGNGKSYGPTFTTDDIIGCGVNLVTNQCFYTKNGHNLGIAFQDLPVRRHSFDLDTVRLYLSMFYFSRNCIQRLDYKLLVKLLMQTSANNRSYSISRICSKN